jgi:uncharacterized protein (TIGR03067 family)
MATLGTQAVGTRGSLSTCEVWFLGVLAGLLSLTSGARADEQQLASATLKAVKQSTVYLKVNLGDNRRIQGSGFFTGEPNLVLTNAHVIGMGKDQSDFPDRIDVVVNSGQEDERSYLGEVVGVDPELDLAVVRVVSNDKLAPPLTVVSGRDLEETQTVFIFGFPLGRDLGKQITVSKSSISSLRKDESGVLERIQVNGGMHPGNSGGPVVDAKGQVVGVAVAVVRNTQLHLAVPGDRVQDFLGGRVASVWIGKPRQQGAKLMADVRVRLIDPMDRVTSVSLDYWLGPNGKSRPPSSISALPVKGDSPRQTLSLGLAEGVAEGKWTIPLPGEGQVIWAQPRFLTKSGEKRWAQATIIRPAPPEPGGAEAAASGATNAVDKEKREAAAEKELKTIEGNWKLVRREVSGSLEDVDDLKLAVVIEDAKMTWTKDGKDTGLSASVELDPTATPAAIDLEFTGAKLLGEQRLGIYRLDGDKLILCWNKAEDRRPKKFTTRLSVGCGTVHETYLRIPD